jgi:hypothetical protein
MENQDAENLLKHLHNIQILIEKLKINGGTVTKAKKQLY